jgi:hypothetical protein
MIKHVRIAVWLGVAALLATSGAAAQGMQPQAGRGRAGQRAAAGLAVGEVEKLFDGYVAMQAQEALKLTDAQFPQFLARLQALQQARRQHLVARRTIVAELSGLLRTPAPAEGALADGLRRLREAEAKYGDDLRRAYEGIDQVLDPAQQARFRVFEESVERRKFDLMLRARRSAQDEGRGPLR